MSTAAEGDAAAPISPEAPPPASSPDGAEGFRLRGNPPRVTRLSRKALAVLGMTSGLGIGGSLIYALQHRPPAQPAQNLYSSDNRTKADAVVAAPADYSKVPKLGQPLPGDLGRPILNAQANGQGVPVPAMGQQDGSNPRVAAAEQAHQRIVQERDSARTSRLFLGESDTAPSSAEGSAAANPAGSNVANPPPGSPLTVASAISPSDQAGKRAFLEQPGNRTTVGTDRLSAPASPYIVQAGSIIPAALITGIRSDLPGQITAQVTQNVYDSPTGRILLIPQGARLIGEYDSQVSAGQNRVLLAWDRLILPGGRSILLDRQPGADDAGFAGLQDKSDYHWGNMLRAALVSTLLGIGTEMATDNDDDLVQALRYGTQDTVNQTGRQLVQREINVPPTLTIRPGTPLRVIVTRDLVIETAAPETNP